jgi:hypothetical protein
MRLSSKSLFILLFSIISFSCTKSKSVDEFSTNQSLWKGKNIQNYTFTLRLICYCPPARTGPHTVRVVNGKIASVNGKPYDESVTGKIYPITEYFDFINSSLAQKPFRSDISYNPKYGYPEIVYFDFSEAIADDEIRYAITSFILN